MLIASSTDGTTHVPLHNQPANLQMMTPWIAIVVGGGGGGRSIWTVVAKIPQGTWWIPSSAAVVQAGVWLSESNVSEWAALDQYEDGPLAIFLPAGVSTKEQKNIQNMPCLREGIPNRPSPPSVICWIELCAHKSPPAGATSATSPSSRLLEWPWLFLLRSLYEFITVRMVVVVLWLAGCSYLWTRGMYNRILIYWLKGRTNCHHFITVHLPRMDMHLLLAGA